MNNTQAINVRRMVNRLELMSLESFSVSTFTNQVAAEVILRTISGWGDLEWVRLGTTSGINPLKPSALERERVKDVFEARSRILKLEGARYMVRFYNTEIRVPDVRYFAEPIDACEFAAEQQLFGYSPAEVTVVEPLKRSTPRQENVDRLRESHRDPSLDRSQALSRHDNQNR
jgi:hypothetical protein